MAHDVFICHSSQDKLVANAACAKLEVSGVRCWIAPRDPLPGKPYGEQIVQAIAHSRIVLLVFSEHANRSRAVLGELELASNREKIILPFRIEDVVPSDGLEFYIRSVHWLDAMTPPIESRLADLVALVQRILETLPPQPGAEGAEVHAAAAEAPAEVRHLKVTWGAVGSKIVPGSAISYSYAKLPGQEDDEQVELVDAVGGATPVEVYERTSTSEITLGKIDVPKEARPGSKWRLRVTTWDESGQPIVASTTPFTVASPSHDAPVAPPLASASSATVAPPSSSSSAEAASASAMGAFAAPPGAAPPGAPPPGAPPPVSPSPPPSFGSPSPAAAPKTSGSPISEPAAREAIEGQGAPPPPPKRFAAIAVGIGAAALLAIVLLINALKPHPQAVAVVSPAPASPSHTAVAHATAHPKVAAKKIAPAPHKKPTPAAAHTPAPAPTPAAKPTPAATPKPVPTRAPTPHPAPKPKPTAKAVVLAPAQARIPARTGGGAPDGYVVMYDSVPGVYWHAVECNQNGSDARIGFRLYNGYSQSLYYETGLTNHAGTMPYDAWIPTRYVLDPGGTSITFYRTLSNWTCGVGTVYAALRHVRFGQDSGPYVPL